MQKNAIAGIGIAITAGISLVLSVAPAYSKTNDNLVLINPAATPTHVSRWLGIMWAGVMTHPIVSVFYTVERAVRNPDDAGKYVRLTPTAYALLSGYFHSYSCSNINVSAKPPYPNTIRTYELRNGRIHNICFMPHDPGCGFLSRLMVQPGVDWAHKDTFPLIQFQYELGCHASKGP